jgi:hypothetical protein
MEDVKKALPAESEDISVKESVTTVTLLKERQARELASVPREQRAKTLEAAVQTAPNGKPTAAHIKQVAQTVKDKPTASIGDIVKHHQARTPVHKTSDDKLQEHEQRILDALKAIREKKLYERGSSSFEEYLDKLFERIEETFEGIEEEFEGAI